MKKYLLNEENLDEKKKKKPYSSITYTTGDIQKNIDHFNKMLGGKEDSFHQEGYLNGTIDAASPDGSNCISSDSGAAGDSASGCCESCKLTEVKRYVRRYYMRPQNIFCSNKAEVLKALIDHEDENCTIYTLNNLGDVKDVTKLNNDDIIYYYDDGILYDKNRIRIMDYELAIKHEEERPRINPEEVSDAKLADVYADRMTAATDLDEEFNLDFEAVNAYGEKLTEDKKHLCCICGEEIEGYGNNAEPYKEGKCCDACNIKFVIPARIDKLNKKEEK